MSAAVSPPDQTSFAFIRRLLRQHAAIALDADKEYLVRTRLEPLARKLGLSTPGQIVDRIRSQPFGELHREVIEALLTAETSFFRDGHPFDALRDDILPALIDSRRATRTLTIWSAACASGQEPYSVAMLLAEHFPKLASWNVRIVATDLSQRALQRARAGLFSDVEVSRGLPPTLLCKYFTRRGDGWLLADDIRRRVQFQQQNLIASWPALPPVDVVLLRNVLIYLTSQARRHVLEQMKLHLASDGALLLGGAETTLGIDPRWQRSACGRTSVYRLRPDQAGQAAKTRPNPDALNQPGGPDQPMLSSAYKKPELNPRRKERG